MTKPAIVHSDKLVMAVRKVLKSIEPRPEPTEKRKSPFGFPQVQCPDCGEWCSAKRGSYNHHWTLIHGPPFWKEQKLIKLIRSKQS